MPSEPISAERLEEILQLEERATPGPVAKGITVDYRLCLVVNDDVPVAYFPKRNREDRELYFAARNSIRPIIEDLIARRKREAPVRVERKNLKIHSSRLAVCCSTILNGTENYCPSCGKPLEWK